MDATHSYEDFTDIYKRLKQKGYSDTEIEQLLELAFGNKAFEVGEELNLTPEEKERFDSALRAQGWGFLFDEEKRVKEALKNE